MASVTLDVIVVKLLVSDYFKFKRVPFLSGRQNTSHVCRGNQSEMDQFENRYYTFLFYLEEVENKDSGLHLIHIKKLESYIVKNIENENNTCAICQDDYKLNQKCGITKCHHSFPTIRLRNCGCLNNERLCNNEDINYSEQLGILRKISFANVPMSI